MKALLQVVFALCVICSLMCSCDTTDRATVGSASQHADDITAGTTGEHTGEVVDKPISWDIQTDAYSITESDGLLYLNFTEEYRATQEQINNCQLGSTACTF